MRYSLVLDEDGDYDIVVDESRRFTYRESADVYGISKKDISEVISLFLENIYGEDISYSEMWDAHIAKILSSLP